MKSSIETKEAPVAIGPYSQAIYFNRVVYVSGQLPLHPDTGEIVGDDIVKQTQQVLKNIDAILFNAGSNKNNILKTTIFITDINDFYKVNDIYSGYVKGTVYPARSTIGVSALPKGALVEIEVVAGI
ncbi:RidA family protein [Salmonella enterica subsp. enterica serovar Sandiego]|nr:RidA family protein [Salmonella enterica subsp. enterica serovar Sandiego]